MEHQGIRASWLSAVLNLVEGNAGEAEGVAQQAVEALALGYGVCRCSLTGTCIYSSSYDASYAKNYTANNNPLIIC